MSPLLRLLAVSAITVGTLTLSFLTAADTPPEIAKLITQLKDPDESVRLKAAKELGKLKEKAAPAVETLTKVAASDPDEDVRTVAKKALAAIKESVSEVDKEMDKEIVVPFVKALKSKKVAERTTALEELTKLGEKARPATTAIVEAMMDTSPTVSEAAAGCLEKVDPTLHKHVVSLLYDKSDIHKADAVAQLGKLGARAKGAVPVLKFYYSANTAKHRSADTATLAALVSIVPDDPLIVNEVLQIVANAPAGRFEDVRGRGLQLLDSIEVSKKKKVEALTAALADTRLRVTVIERLAKFGPDAKSALPALMKLKLDSVPAVRDAATKAIETINAE